MKKNFIKFRFVPIESYMENFERTSYASERHLEFTKWLSDRFFGESGFSEASAVSLPLHAVYVDGLQGEGGGEEGGVEEAGGAVGGVGEIWSRGSWSAFGPASAFAEAVCVHAEFEPERGSICDFERDGGQALVFGNGGVVYLDGIGGDQFEAFLGEDVTEMVFCVVFQPDGKSGMGAFGRFAGHPGTDGTSATEHSGHEHTAFDHGLGHKAEHANACIFHNLDGAARRGPVGREVPWWHRGEGFALPLGFDGFA